MRKANRSGIEQDFAQWGRLLDAANKVNRRVKHYNTPEEREWKDFDDSLEYKYGISGAGLALVAAGLHTQYTTRGGEVVDVVDDEPEEQEDLLDVAGRMYDPERHDPDSIHFDDSYTGPSERELMGGCNRCGGLDDCYCL